jgi:hypothetical protein
MENLQISLKLRKNIENGKIAVCILEIFSLTALENFPNGDHKVAL